MSKDGTVDGVQEASLPVQVKDLLGFGVLLVNT